MKLFIQIPCFNESETLEETLSFIPKKILGFKSVEILIIDDGSSDNTIDIAKRFGVKHIVKHQMNKGLAAAFMSGINYCIDHGADVIVNTDADNQYDISSIHHLLKPLLDDAADIVIGSRPIKSIDNFSRTKKFLQYLGSYTLRKISKTNIEDGPSGFRAIKREAAKKLIVFNEYTYTLETIIQAGYQNIKLISVPINVNPVHRESRLVKSNFSYIRKSVITMLRIYVVYKPFRFFCFLSLLFILLGLILAFRYLIFYIKGDGSGHIQSLLVATIFFVIGFFSLYIAFLSDLIASNRKLLEDIRSKITKESNK